MVLPFSPSMLSSVRFGKIPTTISLSDILGWWDVDEGSGTTIGDKAGSPHNGTAAGTSWITDGPLYLPNGLDFVPANDSWVDFNYTTPALQNGTVCAWVKLDIFAPDGNAAIIIGNGNGGGVFDLLCNPTSEFNGRSRVGGSNRDVSASGFSTEQIYFVAYGWHVADSDDESELWVDGVSVNTASGTWGSIDAPSFSVVSGRRASEAAQREMDGQAYQYLLFNRKLTLAEIQSLYNGGAGATFEMMQFA